MKYSASIIKYIRCIKNTHSVFYKLYKIIICSKYEFQKCFKKHSLAYKKRGDIILV